MHSFSSWNVSHLSYIYKRLISFWIASKSIFSSEMNSKCRKPKDIKSISLKSFMEPASSAYFLFLHVGCTQRKEVKEKALSLSLCLSLSFSLLSFIPVSPFLRFALYRTTHNFFFFASFLPFHSFNCLLQKEWSGKPEEMSQ